MNVFGIGSKAIGSKVRQGWSKGRYYCICRAASKGKWSINDQVELHVNGAIVEIDIQKYFNSIPHTQMLEFLKSKISDKRFLKLIEIYFRKYKKSKTFYDIFV